MDQNEASPLIEYKDRFFGIFESAITSSNEYNGLRLSGLKGLELMVLTKNYLSQNEVKANIIYSCFNYEFALNIVVSIYLPVF